MPISLDELKQLSVAEKLRIIEELWDDFSNTQPQLPLPKHVREEATRRLKEMQETGIGESHEEMWAKVNERLSPS